MSAPTNTVRTLENHIRVCQELFSLLEEENRALTTETEGGAPGVTERRAALIPQLDLSLEALRVERQRWHALTPRERQAQPEVAELLHRAQAMVMRAIVLDRENEQALLRRGLIPANHLPAASRQRPHYVADLYRRHGNT